MVPASRILYEGESNNWINFDDFKVTHTKTNVIQYNEYYPFGMQTSTSWTRENSSNNFLYNEGSELNAATGLYSTFFRDYDPVLGRFLQVDPLSHVDHSTSPFVYGGNNPIFFNDPFGDLKKDKKPKRTDRPGPPRYDGNYNFGSETGEYGGDTGGGGSYAGSLYLPGNKSQDTNFGSNSWSNTIYTDPNGKPTGQKLQTGNPGSDARKGCPTCPNNGNVQKKNFIYENEASIGLGISTFEPGFGAAWDAVRSNPGAYTKGTTNIAKGAGAGLVILNVGLTAYVVNEELNNGSYNTHTFLDVGIAATGVVLTGVGLVLTAPAWAITGTVIGVGYGIWTVTGGDARIDNATNNWGKNLIDYWKK